MRNIILGFCMVLSPQFSFAQEFAVELLSDTVLTGLADPQIPIIFHFEAYNLGEETFLVDMIREETVIPDGWEISLCTEACFPPEVTEAIFFLDEIATDEASVYFYASSEGSGMTRIRFTNTEDSTNTFEYDLYVDAQPLGIHDFNSVSNNIEYNIGIGTIEIRAKENIGHEIVYVYNVMGALINEIQLNQKYTIINTSDWSLGLYFIKLNEFQTVKLVIQ